MRSFLKFSAWALLLVFMASLVVAGLVFGLVHEGLSDHGSWQVVVDGEDVFNSALGADSGWNVLGAVLGLAVALLCVLFVVPLVLLLGGGLPLLGVLIALAAVAASLLGVAALLASPLLIPLLLAVMLLRRAQRPKPSSDQRLVPSA